MPDEKPIEEVTDVTLDTTEIEYTSNGEYIAAACNSLCAIDGMDHALMKRGAKKKIDEIKQWSLDIIHSALSEMHAEIFGEDEDD